MSRRGIATRTIYDGEARPLEVRRDGLLIEKTEYDGNGNRTRVLETIADFRGGIRGAF